MYVCVHAYMDVCTYCVYHCMACMYCVYALCGIHARGDTPTYICHILVIQYIIRSQAKTFQNVQPLPETSAEHPQMQRTNATHKCNAQMHRISPHVLQYILEEDRAWPTPKFPDTHVIAPQADSCVIALPLLSLVPLVVS